VREGCERGSERRKEELVRKCTTISQNPESAPIGDILIVVFL